MTDNSIYQNIIWARCCDRYLNDKPLQLVEKKHVVTVVTTVVETLVTLTVNQTVPEDSGIYKAVVTNTVGETSTEAPVKINGKIRKCDS